MVSYPWVVASFERPKWTVPTRELRSAIARSGPLELPIPAAELQTATYIPRLSFRSGPRVAAHKANVAGNLHQARDHALFIDSSIVGRQDDPEFWEALLCHPNRVFLTPRVEHELRSHFEVRRDHPLSRGLVAKDRAIVWHPDPPNGSVEQNAALYYLNLLAGRRSVLERAYRRYARIHHEDPDDAARAEILANVQSDIRERGLLLCRKPLSPSLADEMLVYQALAHAVRTGQPTKILTKDRDIEEQFLKLVELVTMHYWAMLIAREYIADFSRFRPRRMDERDLNDSSGAYQTATLLELGDRAIHDFTGTRTRWVPISCVLMTEYVSELAYGAETGMSAVLEIKGRTGGLSTDLLGDRDVHAYYLPELRWSTRQPGAIVSRDVREYVPGSDLFLAKHDVMQAINTQLVMRPVTAAPQSSRILTRRAPSPNRAGPPPPHARPRSRANRRSG